MNIVIVGRRGQLAWELQRALPNLGPVTTIGRPEIDLANPGPIRQIIRQLAPEVLVNAAAYTAVDQAEGEPAIVKAVNSEAPRVLAEEAKRANALFITYSTDYVFDGKKTSAYYESDLPNPLGVYGASKLAGDREVEAVGGAYLIFRTSWVYGPRGRNFLRTVIRLVAERDELRVVDDQIGAPTSSKDLANATMQIVRRLAGQADGLDTETLGDRAGVYNMTAQGSVSWCGFAQTIVEEMRRRAMSKKGLANVVPISTELYPTAAIRPRNSRLSNEKLRQTFGVALPDWKASLAEVMDEIEVSGSCEAGPAGGSPGR